METITYSQVQALVEQIPKARLPAAYHVLRELVNRGEMLEAQVNFLRFLWRSAARSLPAKPSS